MPSLDQHWQAVVWRLLHVIQMSISAKQVVETHTHTHTHTWSHKEHRASGFPDSFKQLRQERNWGKGIEWATGPDIGQCILALWAKTAVGTCRAGPVGVL